MIDIISDFEEYTNDFGFLTEWKNPGRKEAHNGILFTALQMLCYRLVGIDGTFWANRFEQTIQALESCRIEPGLFKRSPGITELEQHDDLIGVAYLSRRLGNEILEYGLRGQGFGPFTLHYFYNTERPGSLYNPEGKIFWKAWLWRQQPFVAHLHHCLGVEAPWLATLAWRNSLKTSGTPNSQDDWMLNRLLVEGWISPHFERGADPDDRAAVGIWRERFKEAWPGGFGALFARYFEAGWDHPLAKHWPKEDWL